MREWQSQSHVRWYCRYHIVFVPKYRKRAILGQLRKGIGKILRELCDQFGVELVEGHAMPDHIHMCLSIPPKFSVANTVGRLKGKSAILIHRRYLGKQRNFMRGGTITDGLRVTISDGRSPERGRVGA
jgi:putative transposase